MQRQKGEEQRKEEGEGNKREERMVDNAEGKLGKVEERSGSMLVRERMEVGNRIEALVRDNTTAFLACKLVPSMGQLADAPSSVGVHGDAGVFETDVAEQSFVRNEVELAEEIVKFHLDREQLEVELKGKEVLQGIQLHRGYRARRYIVLRTCKCRGGRNDKGCCERLREGEGCGWLRKKIDQIHRRQLSR